VYTGWLGKDYDLDAFDAMLAAVAVERLDGDAIWLLIISGSGNAKTETVQALDGIHAIITSTIPSEGALLSATRAKVKVKDATSGLLRKIGDRGVLVIKDMTSVLSMNRDMRAQVLGALRESLKWMLLAAPAPDIGEALTAPGPCQSDQRRVTPDEPTTPASIWAVGPIRSSALRSYCPPSAVPIAERPADLRPSVLALTIVTWGWVNVGDRRRSETGRQSRAKS
jgi:hypothetical protein